MSKRRNYIKMSYVTDFLHLLPFVKLIKQRDLSYAASKSAATLQSIRRPSSNRSFNKSPWLRFFFLMYSFTAYNIICLASKTIEHVHIIYFISTLYFSRVLYSFWFSKWRSSLKCANKKGTVIYLLPSHCLK